VTVQQVEDVLVDGWPGGLHKVEGEAVSGSLVEVEHAESGVESDGDGCDACFGFEERI
jgi:hypothetical protein